ncbi:P-loop containing nucleoside triphosphate hydrolase protein, partial [Didymella exigua CBS 183.55]
ADNEGEEDVEDNPINLGSRHRSKFAGQIYGRPIDESPFSIMAQRQALRRVSIAWHRFLQFSSTLKTPPAKGTRAAEARKEAVEEQFRRWKQMRRVDVQAALERLQGKGSTFRSVQQPAIEAIMKQKSPVVVIMGTGGGKSATFMLPASCSTGVTIVVVPVVALKQNMMDRCKAAGIDCVLWDSQRPHEWASIVLVVPKSVATLAFEQFINRQRSMGWLDRVVIDECHTILDSVKGWRTKVLKLRELVKAETQLVCLTATLKPTEESEFIRLMALPPKEQCEWFRAPTSRPNLAYKVHWYNHREKSEADVLAELVEEKKQQYPLPGQIVVYTDSRKKAQGYAAMLGAVCYHREVGTPEEKLEILRQLTEGTEHVFVATNALGLGIDRETVRAVLFAGSRNTQKMRDVVQMGGRAGRGGLPSEVIFIRGATYSPQGKRYASGWAKDTEEGVRELVEGDGCMRVIIDREMDGNHTREGCEPGEEPCGRCQLRVHSAGAEVEAAVGDEDETERAE